ncbi:unnamed protein product [Effrenium voratum]|nr:unnamed protein product [Effrenium voratum]
MVTRKYNQLESNYQTVATRSDAHHYPNYIDVKDSDHYKDHRRRNCHCEPARWVVDPKLRAAVTDREVEQRLRAERGETRSYPDPDILGILFGEDVKPQKETFKQLNVDLSCVDLPHQEGGPVKGRQKFLERKNFMPEPVPPPERWAIVFSILRWKWCKEERKLLDTTAAWSEEKAQLHRSQSLPQAVRGVGSLGPAAAAPSRPGLAGPSLLPGANGAPASPFHGLATRRFGEDSGWDGRMRGSLLARRNWAGTAPDKDVRWDSLPGCLACCHGTYTEIWLWVKTNGTILGEVHDPF